MNASTALAIFRIVLTIAVTAESVISQMLESKDDKDH